MFLEKHCKAKEPPGFIDGYLASRGTNADDLRAWRQAATQYGADNIARAKAAVREVEEAQAGEFRPVSAIADFFGKNAIGRAAASALQGMNRGNPAVGLVSLIPGMETINDDVVEAETPLEKGIGMAAEFAAPAGLSAKAAGMIGKAPKIAAMLGKSKAGRLIAGALKPSAMPLEYAGAAGAGLLTGAVDPKTAAGRVLTGLAGGMLGAGGAALANGFGPMKNYIGKSALRDQLGNAATQAKHSGGGLAGRILRAGADVEDAGFGKLSQDRLSKLNDLRELKGLFRAKDGKITIPADRAAHLYAARSVDKNYSPKKLARVLDSALYGKGSALSRQPSKDTIAFINRFSEPGHVAYVGNRNDGNIIVSGQEMRGSNITPRKYIDLDERPSVSSEPVGSQLQGPAGSVGAIINPSAPEVKRAYRLVEETLGSGHGRAAGREKLSALLSAGRPLIDQGDPAILDLGRAARDASPDAAAKIITRMRKASTEAPDAINAAIDGLVDGDKKLAADALAELKSSYGDLADARRKLANKRNILPDAEYKAAVSDPHVSAALEYVDKNVPHLRGVRPNNIERLHYAERRLDELANFAKERKDKLIEAEYKRARTALGDMLKKRDLNFREAQKLDALHLGAAEASAEAPRFAQKYYRNADQVRKKMAGWTTIQKNQARTAYLNEVRDRLLNTESSYAGAKGMLAPSRLGISEAVLGGEKAAELEKLLRGIVARTDAERRILGGSMTSTNLGGASGAIGAIEEFTSPKSAVKGIARRFDTARSRRTMGALADLLLADPRALRAPGERPAAFGAPLGMPPRAWMLPSILAGMPENGQR